MSFQNEVFERNYIRKKLSKREERERERERYVLERSFRQSNSVIGSEQQQTNNTIKKSSLSPQKFFL